MQRFLKLSSLFTYYTVIVYLLLLLIYGECIPLKLWKNLYPANTKRGDFLYKRLEDINNYKDVDILFVGSSHAYLSFDTRIFSALGYTSFNLGTTHQTPIQTEILLNIYLKRLKPKIVIFEVFPLMFESDGVESEIDFILSAPKINLQLLSMVKSYQNMKILNTLLYQKLKGGIEQRSRIRVDVSEEKRKYIPGGYVETSFGFNRAVRNPYKSKDWSPLIKQQHALNNIIHLLKINHIKLIMVQTPVRKQFYDFLKNQNNVDSYFKSKGIYYNFNKSHIFNDTTDFFDSNHLNKNGSLLLDQEFIKRFLNKK